MDSLRRKNIEDIGMVLVIILCMVSVVLVARYANKVCKPNIEIKK